MLTALYLRGAPRPFDVKRGSWMAVERCLRLRASSLEHASETLRAAGLWAEATALQTPNLLAWAEDAVADGKVLTASDEIYPRRWLEVLGASAPPAVWVRGDVPPQPFVSIVGSRNGTTRVLRFARECGVAASQAGYAVVSGGARGCDSAASRGATNALQILPYGFASPLPFDGGAVTVCAPHEVFSTATAMERRTHCAAN